MYSILMAVITHKITYKIRCKLAHKITARLRYLQRLFYTARYLAVSGRLLNTADIEILGVSLLII